MAAKLAKVPPTIAEVLCDSGRGGEVELSPKVGEEIGEVIERAGDALDGASLHNVVVLCGSDGKYRVGEFAFTLREVSAREAARVARDFDPDR